MQATAELGMVLWRPRRIPGANPHSSRNSCPAHEQFILHNYRLTPRKCVVLVGLFSLHFKAGNEDFWLWEKVPSLKQAASSSTAAHVNFKKAATRRHANMTRYPILMLSKNDKQAVDKKAALSRLACTGTCTPFAVIHGMPPPCLLSNTGYFT